jgi:hypothetical protein
MNKKKDMHKKYVQEKRKEMGDFYMMNSFQVALNNLAELEFNADGFHDLSLDQTKKLRNEANRWINAILKV